MRALAAVARSRSRRSAKRYGAKAFSIRAGKTATVRVKLSKKAFKRLKRTRRRIKVALRATGTDTSGAKMSATKSVRLLRPKRR